MGRKIEALWDCAYCGAKGIGGLTKQCPNCGHPQDKDIKFYLPDKIEENVLDEQTAEQYGKGADWMCAYCHSLNRYYDETCQNCGADRKEQLGDYFSNKDQSEREAVKSGEKHGEPKDKSEEAKTKPADEKTKSADKKDHSAESKNNSAAKKNHSSKSKNKSADKKKKQMSFYEFQKMQAEKKHLPLKVIIPALVALMALVLLFIFIPRTSSVTLDHKEWTRSIAVEEYKTLQESDWSVPSGGRVYDQKKEIHHYDRVIDYYETVSVEHYRDVLDGYDTSYKYVSNGDGTYDEVEVSTPRYRSESYYEDEERPVYKDVPVYQTKYYYEIDRWVETRSVDTQGQEEEPYWGQVNLSENEREGPHSEEYQLVFTTKKGKIYRAKVSQDYWKEVKIGDSFDITLQNGKVKKINGKEIK